MRKISFNRYVLFWFVLAGFLLGVSAAIIYVNFKRVSTQQARVSHTYEVINNLEEVLSLLKDVQSSQRGYIITGQDDYLTPYDLAQPKLKEQFDALEKQVSDNPQQSQRLLTVEVIAAQRVETAHEIIAAYKERGQETAFEMVKAGNGKREMDEIRVLIHEMIAHERSLLQDRQGRVNQSSSLTVRLAAIVLCVIGLILVLIICLTNREMTKRARVEESLGKTLEDLKILSENDRIVSEMSDYLQSCTSLEEAYGVMTRTFPQLLKRTGGALYFFNESRNLLEQTLFWGRNEEKAEPLISPEQCWGLRRGQVHHMTQNGVEPMCTHFKTPVHEALCLPLQAHGETIGLMHVTAADAPTLDAVKAMALRISEQASLAVSNLKMQETLRNQSIRDPMTGLFNRRYLEETMEREFSRSRRYDQDLSILVLDIDHFKKYNDTMGHDAGDALLIGFAQMVQKTTRKEDIVCRYGGEEFIVVLPATSSALAEQVGQKICDATRAMRIKAGTKDLGQVTVSIGVATYPADADSPDILISCADQALYQAKEGGRDRVCVHNAG